MASCGGDGREAFRARAYLEHDDEHEHHGGPGDEPVIQLDVLS